MSGFLHVRPPVSYAKLLSFSCCMEQKEVVFAQFGVILFPFLVAKWRY